MESDGNRDDLAKEEPRESVPSNAEGPEPEVDQEEQQIILEEQEMPEEKLSEVPSEEMQPINLKNATTEIDIASQFAP